ncbi:MAG: hypothetical protein MUC50_24190, partial [Myxococcota bacterium]|nr:hypothetical protein [Myxococcota bacterium]
MKLIDACKSGLAPAALLLLSLPSCDSESSQYDALRQDLRTYQQAATKTVDSMVAVQAGLTALAASAELSDEELTAAVRSFDEAVDDFGHAAEQIVAAETNIQNAIRDLSTSQSGVGVVQQALGARDVANVLTGGVVGLADKMDANRQAINAAY